MPQETTIYDIAKEAGVSTATVSRVINNYPYVNKDTRAKVLKTIEENNFVLNESARCLVTQNSKMVGILIADLRTTHHTEGVYYIEHEFSKKGYSCLIYNTGNDFDQQAKYIQLLSKRKVEAVVLMGSIYQNTSVQNAIMIYLPDTPVAICNGFLVGANIYGVFSDEFGGVMKAVELLKKKGKNNLAFITNKLTPSNNSKVEGFKEGLQKYYGNNEAMVMVVNSETVRDIEDETKKLLTKVPDIDAIIFSEDFIALAAMHAITEMGLSIPNQIAIIGMNNSRYAEISNPSLTSIDNMLYDTSLIAVRNLIEVLNGERVNHKIRIDSEIVERHTT